MSSLSVSRRLVRTLVNRNPTARISRRRPLSTSSSVNPAITRPLSSLSAIAKPTIPLESPAGVGAASAVQDKVDLQGVIAEMNERTKELEHDPLGIIRWASEEFDGRIAMSTSFGIQSAILLHAATQVMPDIPVVWVDTGYLPKETYEYAEQLKEALDLNLIIRSNTQWTPARMEAIYGKLWEKEDAESHTLYGRMRKVEPMQAGLDSIKPNPRVLLSGLRAAQTKARANMPVVGFQNDRFKVLPLLRMTDEQVDQYMDMYDLPVHPLVAQGYATVGDWHSSRPVAEGEDARATRFGGKFQECGLHAEETEVITADSDAEDDTTDNVTMLESTKRTKVDALETVSALPETDMAVIMVKKVMEDGSYCRKCNDVAEKMKKDDVEKWIGYTAHAEVLNSESEGSRLAKHFGVATAPFFLTRTIEQQKQGEDWNVVRSYLQLRKKLQTAADAVETRLEEAESETAEEHAKQVREARKHLDELQRHVERLQSELAQSEKKMQDTKNFFQAKFPEEEISASTTD